MPSVRVLRSWGADEIQSSELTRIRQAWAKAGREVEKDVPAGICCIAGCRTMPFVTLRTNDGRRAICLRHFEQLNVEGV